LGHQPDSLLVLLSVRAYVPKLHPQLLTENYIGPILTGANGGGCGCAVGAASLLRKEARGDIYGGYAAASSVILAVGETMVVQLQLL
jgi:hypothetical protein